MKIKAVENYKGEFYHGAAVAFFHNKVRRLSIPRLFYDFSYCFEEGEINILEDEFKFQVISSSGSHPLDNVSNSLK